jgi:phage shock protein E
MFKSLVAAAVLATTVCAAYADEPMTLEAVSASAKDGIAFVDNDYIFVRQATNPDLLLLDVRTEREFNLGHIPGATWMARGVVEFQIARTVRDADTEIIIYCETGNRAALAKKTLDAQGYRNVAAHQGFETWSEAGRPLENEIGTLQLIEGRNGK